MRRTALALAVVLFPVLTGGAHADVTISGGGRVNSDCYAEFVVTGQNAPGSPTLVQCNDGDACDLDGLEDNSCTFGVQVCAFQSDVEGCTPQEVTAFPTNTAALTTPSVPVTTATCAAQSSVIVPLVQKNSGLKPGTKKLKLAAQSTGKPKSDKDKLSLKCLTPLKHCDPNPTGGPNELDFFILDHGTDLDTGFSGASHNFPIPLGSFLKMCLTECGTSTNPVCQASVPTGPDTLNGETFGPPLPLFASGAPTCIVNRFDLDKAAHAAVNMETGTVDFDAPVPLLSEVWSSSSVKVCPECKGGHCDTGAKLGASCTVEGTVPVYNPTSKETTRYSLSHDCPPGGTQASKNGTIPIDLPITTGMQSKSGSKPCPGQAKDDSCGSSASTCSLECSADPDSKGGTNQWCCTDQKHTPCFPTASNSGQPDHAIVREGTPIPAEPAWPNPTYPKTLAERRDIALFCIGSSGSGVVDQVAGLPGPGAIVFNGMVKVLKPE